MENFPQQNPIINLISECFVKPKHMNEASNQPYHLGPTDAVMLSIDPIQKGLLFAFPTTNTPSSSSNNVIIVSNLLHKLKTSLSIALVHFYPLAGRLTTLKSPEENSCSVFVDCNKGLGARFIHATSLKLTVSDIIASSVDVTIARPFFDLGEKYVNFDGHTKALLCIQVTELLDGVFIGFSMSHSVVDGTSFIHFVQMLSEIFNSLDHGSEIVDISRVPVFDYRPWFTSEQHNPLLKFPVLDLENSICRGYDPGPLRERIFNFGPDSLAQLKAKAYRECEAGAHDVIISFFQALTAFVWRSLTRVRGLRSDQETSCFFAIGARNRFEPPVSDDYFGGFISPANWDCKVEELLGHDLGWAAMQLGEFIKTINAKVVLAHFTEIVESPMMIPRGFETGIHGDNSLIMGGSTRFDMYGSEFGLGRALAVRMGYGNKEDGKITANAGCERGSIELEICLRPPIMAALEADQEFMGFVTTNN